MEANVLLSKVLNYDLPSELQSETWPSMPSFIITFGDMVISLCLYAYITNHWIASKRDLKLIFVLYDNDPIDSRRLRPDN